MKLADRVARDVKILRMIGEGHTFARIGEAHLLSEAGVRAIARRHGVEQRRKRKTVAVPSPAEMNRRAREFWSKPGTLVAYGWAMAAALHKGEK